jgi:hypothetical protein
MDRFTSWSPIGSSSLPSTTGTGRSARGCTRAIAPVVTAPRGELVAALRETLARHGEAWPCVHKGIYGTVSSGLLFWGGAEGMLWATDGPSCTNPWRDETALLDALARASAAGGSARARET